MYLFTHQQITHTHTHIHTHNAYADIPINIVVYVYNNTYCTYIPHDRKPAVASALLSIHRIMFIITYT